MALSIGTKLGAYEIVAQIGAGGMGEVYRARDTRLGRSVALKILPGSFSSDGEQLRRFEREARSASALNHPNIITIYELGEEAGIHYIAMELIDGKTLRALLGAGGLPIRKVIEIAAQIAEGLAKAHEAGIVHRDLKPDNLMVTHDGFVKILDFGLVKNLPVGETSADDSTLTVTDTRTGAILGTPGYMSPEQAGGHPADFRSDQFSLGLVLYEIVTGKRAFKRNTAAETMTAILREHTEPIAAQNPDAPAPLCWAIERCLDKEPAKRYGSTRDLARELAAIRDRFAETPVREAQTARVSIPVQRTGFVGRETEIAAVKELLLRDDVRLVTVTGPGGIGKTRFAVEVANTLVEHLPGGILFVALSGVSDAGQLAPVIVQALKLREAGGQSPLEILDKYLQDSQRAPMLLLLDNFEHLAAAAPTVAEILAMGPRLKILVTSRAALHVYGEREYPIAPLALPDKRTILNLEDLAQSPAVALFVQRAVAAKPDFELNKENAAAIAEICARLDGLPLAIELAAARVKVLSPSAMKTRLASRLQLLTGGAQDMPQRQRTLRAAMDWSHELLSAAEQKLFRRLAVFAGGCTLESAEAVCDASADLGLDTLDGMSSIVDKSLLRQLEQPNGESRYAMLETIREYAFEKLKASGEEAATKRSRAAYCLVLAEEGAAAHSGAMEAEWLERFTLEHDNFRASLEWLVETGEAEWGMRLGAALFRFWEVREYFAEGRHWLDKVLKLPASAKTNKARGRALFAAGVLAYGQGDYAHANSQLRESLEIARESSDKQAVAVSLNALALIARESGDMRSARSLSEQTLAQWRELGDQNTVARALSNLANVAKLEGDHKQALDLYAECVAVFRDLGDETGLAWTLNYQGDVARDQGELYVARALNEQSLAIFRKLKNGWGVASALADLGNLAMEERDDSAMRAFYRESIAIFQELDHKRGIARLLESFALAAAAQHHPERALRLAGAAAGLRQNIGIPLTPSEQVKLKASLDAARQIVSNAAGNQAWLEGYGLTVDDAIAEALKPDVAGPGVRKQDASGSDLSSSPS
jgi:predicted ATPase